MLVQMKSVWDIHTVLSADRVLADSDKRYIRKLD